MLINGVELHVVDEGSGAPIVFSHGLLWSGRMFEGQAAALKSRYRCIRYDHRGQGQSATSPEPYDMEQLADDAASLIQKLNAAPCHFVGLSMGGFVGLRLALERPDLLKSLTLIESAGDAEPRINVPKYKAMSLFSRFFGYRPLLRAVMKIMFGKTFLNDPSRAGVRRDQEAQLLALDPVRVDPALASVIWRRPLMDRLDRVKTPTQIVHGTEDRAIVPERAKKTCNAIPHARWVPIDHAGHTSSVEEPAAVTAALESFFKSI